MNRADAFSTYNPIVVFVYFLLAMGMGMFFLHPVFLLCNIIAALAYGCSLHARKCMKVLLASLPIALVVAAVNPLFNTGGQTVLFLVFERPYTLEALLWGFVMGSKFLAIFLWFFSFNLLMTSDKLLYLFGGVAPSITLSLTMILRLVPNLTKKLRQIATARACIGRSSRTLEGSSSVVSALTSCALEGGIETADSMRSRGYGAGKRTHFTVFSFTARDAVMMCVFGVFFLIVAACAFLGGMDASFVPSIHIADLSGFFTTWGLVAYLILLFVPPVLNAMEGILWRISKSTI